MAWQLPVGEKGDGDGGGDGWLEGGEDGEWRGDECGTSMEMHRRCTESFSCKLSLLGLRSLLADPGPEPHPHANLCRMSTMSTR